MKLPQTTLSRLLPWLIIIALLISFGYCGNRYRQDKAAWKRDKAVGDSVTAAQKALILKTQQDAWQYKESQRVAQLLADSAAKAARSYASTVSVQKAEIRQLYAELGRPWPIDTVKIGTECCELANRMTYTVDSLQAADSVKDLAGMQQLDLATSMVDSLSLALAASNRNYRTVDSLRRLSMKDSKPRGKVSAGVGGGFAPGFGWGGAVIRYEGPGGVGYEVEAGPSTVGMYYGGRVTKKISLRKKR